MTRPTRKRSRTRSFAASRATSPRIPLFPARPSRRFADYWSPPSGSSALQPLPGVLECERRHGQHDDAEDDPGEVLLYEGHVAEPIPRVEEQKNPRERSGHVVGGKVEVGHARDAGDERRKSPKDGHESGDDNSLASVLLVEGVSPL